MTHIGQANIRGMGIALVIFLMVGHSKTLAQVEQSTLAEPPLKPLEFLVGGTWEAEGEIAGFGEYTATRTYRWVLGRKFIEQQHTLTTKNTKFETRGIIGWNPDTRKIVAWGFGDDGGITTTCANTQTAEDEFQLEGDRVGPFNAGSIRATFRKIDDNEFTEIAEIKKGEKWEQMFTFGFKRTPAK